MAINTSLLIAAPMLQDYLVDNATGLPLANGTITMFQDNSRTTLKNWYYQSGTPGAYTYITLPNPLTLSGVGTIQDPNGNDTIPFYYPYSETDNITPQPYFVNVVNSNGQQQFTRQNFPFNPNAGTSPTTSSTFKNYIVNGEFYRNKGSINVSSIKQALICPDQHDGFLTIPGSAATSATQLTNYSDTQFLKNTTDATDSVTFNKLPLGTVFANDIAPEFYLNLTCSVAGTDTQKLVQIPIALHIQNLQQQNAVITFWARVNSGSSTITLSLFQFLGSGAVSATPAVLNTFTLNSSWQKFSVKFQFPTVAGLTLGNGGDDAWFLQINYPTSSTFNIDIAKPSLYLGTQFPSNDFISYSTIASIIESPRTGYVRASIDFFGSGYDWLLMNDATIGNPSSNASALASSLTWPLFNLIWNTFQASQTFAPMFTNLGAPISYGSTPIADFNANNTLSLTKAAGRILANVGMAQISGNTTPITGGTNTGVTWPLGSTTGAELHTQSSNELAAHSHALTTTGTLLSVLTPGSGTGITKALVNLDNSSNVFDALLGGTTNNTGVSQAFSVMQPISFLNYFIKL